MSNTNGDIKALEEILQYKMASDNMDDAIPEIIKWANARTKVGSNLKPIWDWVEYWRKTAKTWRENPSEADVMQRCASQLEGDLKAIEAQSGAGEKPLSVVLLYKLCRAVDIAIYNEDGLDGADGEKVLKEANEFIKSAGFQGYPTNNEVKKENDV